MNCAAMRRTCKDTVDGQVMQQLCTIVGKPAWYVWISHELFIHFTKELRLIADRGISHELSASVGPELHDFVRGLDLSSEKSLNVNLNRTAETE